MLKIIFSSQELWEGVFGHVTQRYCTFFQSCCISAYNTHSVFDEENVKKNFFQWNTKTKKADIH